MAQMMMPVPVSAEGYIAGTDPSHRPPDAPRIERVDHGPAWLSRALAGVSQPYPPSLKFLRDQGDWYTPFNHPGMLGVYDLRHLHEHSSAPPNSPKQ
ncbi:MAG: hypothetical protein ACK5JT_22865 [Hyphomicrobiaceae bacterium]